MKEIAEKDLSIDYQLLTVMCCYGWDYSLGSIARCKDVACSELSNGKCKIHQRILALISEREKAMIDLLKEAKCPNCDGSGIIPHQTSTRQLVTHDMASDAGNPALEGSLYSREDFELEPCQWCDERNRLLEEKNG